MVVRQKTCQASRSPREAGIRATPQTKNTIRNHTTTSTAPTTTSLTTTRATRATTMETATTTTTTAMGRNRIGRGKLNIISRLIILWRILALPHVVAPNL